MTEIRRETRETNIHVVVARGAGRADVETGERFLDHMMATIARYSALDVSVRATGDLRHHLIEDVAITFGTAVQRLSAEGVARYGERTIPMDDALVQVVLDLGGRAYYRGRLPSDLYDHWMRSFSDHSGATLHVRVLAGEDRHHIVEAAFKALGMALRDALAPSDGVFSTKGGVVTEEA
jgi:imidazoleglycerol-phosphate dehydratase